MCFSRFNIIIAVSPTKEQQIPIVTHAKETISIDGLSTVISLAALVLSLIISVCASLITFTWKAAQLNAKINLKDITLKGSIAELQRDKLALSRQLEDDNRELRKRAGNLDARTRAVEIHLAKHMSFVPKDIRSLDD